MRGFQHVAILVDQHDARQVPLGGTRCEQFAERPAFLVEQGPRVGNIVRHAQNIAADQLRVFIGVGARNDQGIFDHRPGRPRKQPVKAAVDGDIGNDGDQHGRQDRNDREQADDLDV